MDAVSVISHSSGNFVFPFSSVINDGSWRKVAIDRVGKIMKIRISLPNSANYMEEKTKTIGGFKSVLNLHQKRSRLFVGGIIPGVNVGIFIDAFIHD